MLKLVDENFSVTILRPPMIYGYKAPGNWNKLEGLVRKVIILPFKDIKNERTFLYIKNFTLYLDWIIKENVNNILIITDQFNLSTEEVVKLMLSKNRINRLLINYRIIGFMKNVFAEQFEKLFGDLIIESNILINGLLDKQRVFEDIMAENKT